MKPTNPWVAIWHPFFIWLLKSKYVAVLENSSFIFLALLYWLVQFDTTGWNFRLFLPYKNGNQGCTREYNYANNTFFNYDYWLLNGDYWRILLIWLLWYDWYDYDYWYDHWYLMIIDWWLFNYACLLALVNNLNLNALWPFLTWYWWKLSPIQASNNKCNQQKHP